MSDERQGKADNMLALLAQFDAQTPDTGDITIDEDRLEAALLPAVGRVSPDTLADMQHELTLRFPVGLVLPSRALAAKFDVEFIVACPKDIRSAVRAALLTTEKSEL